MSNDQIFINNQNIFAELMEAAKVRSLGQISRALYVVDRISFMFRQYQHEY